MREDDMGPGRQRGRITSRGGRKRPSTRRKGGLTAFCERIPVFISFSILFSSWAGFFLVVTCYEVLVVRHDRWRFIEQCVIFNALMVLTVVSLLTAVTRSAGHPDPLLAPHGFESNQSGLQNGIDHGLERTTAPDEDDIPLRFLRNSQWASARTTKDRPSPLPVGIHRSHLRKSLDDGHSADDSATDGDMPSSAETDHTPFPLAISPFVPTTPAEAGESDADDSEDSDHTRPSVGRFRKRTARGPALLSIDEGLENDPEGENSATTRLLDDHPEHGRRPHVTPSSAGSNGHSTSLPRWCAKCSSWKPDRTHHCRYCQRCILKMDHHCVWLGTCVGHDNYRPFLLFISYATLLSLYATAESAWSAYQWFTDPPGLRGVSSDLLAQAEEYLRNATSAGSGTRTLHSRADVVILGSGTSITYSSEPLEVDIAPVVMLLLAVTGAFFAMSVGSLAAYHWYLACNNLTTLENMTHTYPTSLMSELDARDAVTGPPTGPINNDHLLTRSERQRLRREARAINVWDLGTRTNLRMLFLGRRDGPPATAVEILRGLWPRSQIERRSGRYSSGASAGHEFPYDAKKLDRLRWVTRELRLGVRKEERIGPYEGEGMDGYAGDDDDDDDDSSEGEEN